MADEDSSMRRGAFVQLRPQIAYDSAFHAWLQTPRLGEKAPRDVLLEARAEAEKKSGKEKIREINIAYRVLSKPLNRAKFDAKLNRRPTPYSEAEPEHCAKCGKPTGYWDTVKQAARCHACTGTIL
jgi:hypothetical protein